MYYHFSPGQKLFVKRSNKNVMDCFFHLLSADSTNRFFRDCQARYAIICCSG